MTEQEMKTIADMVAGQLQGVEERLSSQMAGMATKDDLTGMATKDDLTGMATKDDLTGMATKGDLTAVEKKVDAVQGGVTKLQKDVTYIKKQVDIAYSWVDGIDLRVKTLENA